MRLILPSQGGEPDGDSSPRKCFGGSVEYSHRRFRAYVIYCTSALFGGSHAIQGKLTPYSRKALCETFPRGPSLRRDAKRRIGVPSRNCVFGGLQYADLLPTSSGRFAAGTDENWCFQPSAGRGLQANAGDAEDGWVKPAVLHQALVRTERQPVRKHFGVRCGRAKPKG